MVWDAGVLEVAAADVLKLTRAERGAHAVHHDDDESQLRQRCHVVVEGLERFGHVLVARALIDVFHDGVFLRGVEVRGAGDEAPHVRLAVASWCHEYLRSLPAIFQEFADVGFLQLLHYAAVLGAAQYRLRSLSHGGPCINEVRVVVAEYGAMVSLCGRQVSHVRAVEADAVVVDEIGVLARGCTVGSCMDSVCREVDNLVLLVHVEHLPDVPLSFCDLVDGLPRSTVVEVKMLPAVTLAAPDETLAVLQEAVPEAGIVDVLVACFLSQRAHLARLGRKLQQTVHLMSSGVEFEAHGTAVLIPCGAVQVILIGEELR